MIVTPIRFSISGLGLCIAISIAARESGKRSADRWSVLATMCCCSSLIMLNHAVRGRSFLRGAQEHSDTNRPRCNSSTSWKIEDLLVNRWRLVENREFMTTPASGFVKRGFLRRVVSRPWRGFATLRVFRNTEPRCPAGVVPPVGCRKQTRTKNERNGGRRQSTAKKGCCPWECLDKRATAQSCLTAPCV